MTIKQNPRSSLTVSIPSELRDYLEEKVRIREFSSLSHGVELCILAHQEKDRKA
jgi:Arc/MetJ-type ribon-helix-helix transcriptional regulator